MESALAELRAAASETIAERSMPYKVGHQQRSTASAAPATRLSATRLSATRPSATRLRPILNSQPSMLTPPSPPPPPSALSSARRHRCYTWPSTRVAPTSWGTCCLSRTPGLAVDGGDCFQRTPLAYAACADRVELARMLISHKASLDASDVVGRTPLHLAAAMGHAGSVTLLLESGAIADVADRHVNSAAHYAAIEAREATLTAMLRFPGAKACLRIRNADDLVPLHLAALHGRRPVRRRHP